MIKIQRFSSLRSLVTHTRLSPPRLSFQLLSSAVKRNKFWVGYARRELTMASTMKSANRLKVAFDQAKGPSMGCWQMLPGSNVSRILASTGVDFVLIDCEHGNMDGALDSGAHGVLVPLLYTAEDAKKLVLSAKFPPQGQRGFGSPFPHGRFHTSLGSSDYLQQANDAILTMVQIETKEALEVVEQIAAVPGIDVLFVGPFDLGNNIGHPIIDGVMHSNLEAAIAKVLKAANAAGKKAGIFCTSGTQSRKYAEDGFHMISVATDVLILQSSVMNTLNEAKGLGPAPKLTGPYGK